MLEALYAMLIGTWVIGIIGALCIYHKFHQHTDTIKRVQEWQDAILDTMTEPERDAEIKRVMPSEWPARYAARKCVTALEPIPVGALLTERNIGVRRPCPDGAFPPVELPHLIGRKVLRAVELGEPITPSVIGQHMQPPQVHERFLTKQER